MKVQMTVVYGEHFCEDLKEALKCKSDEEFLGVFKGFIAQSMAQESIPDEDLSIKFELI